MTRFLEALDFIPNNTIHHVCIDTLITGSIGSTKHVCIEFLFVQAGCFRACMSGFPGLQQSCFLILLVKLKARGFAFLSLLLSLKDGVLLGRNRDTGGDLCNSAKAAGLALPSQSKRGLMHP
jgi:hypothetical protein